MILTSHAVRRHYAKQLTDQRRFGDEMVLQGGWTGAKFGNAAIVPDKWASTTNDPANSALADFPRCYVISPDSLEFQVLQELEWEDTGGVMVRAGVGASAVDQLEAYMRTYMNLCAVRPNANVCLYSID